MIEVRHKQERLAPARAGAGGWSPATRSGWPLFGAIAILDPELAVHSARGAAVAACLSREIALPVDDPTWWGFLLRDVGTLDVPTRILRKPGPLTDAEHGVVSGHALRTAQLLAEVDDLAEGARIARAHHERWDGTGYPDRLRGQAIPLPARVLSVADAFAALTAPRPYRGPRGADEAVSVLTAEAGTQFDPTLVWTFAAIAGGLEEPLVRHTRVGDVPGIGHRLLALAERAEDLSRGQLEALYAVAIGLGPDEAADRCGRTVGTHRNWISSLRRSLNCPARQPLPQFLGRLGRGLYEALALSDS